MRELAEWEVLGQRENWPNCCDARNVYNNNNNNNNNRTSDIGTINSNDRIAETLYSLGTWFVSGIYV